MKATVKSSDKWVKFSVGSERLAARDSSTGQFVARNQARLSTQVAAGSAAVKVSVRPAQVERESRIARLNQALELGFLPPKTLTSK